MFSNNTLRKYNNLLSKKENLKDTLQKVNSELKEIEQEITNYLYNNNITKLGNDSITVTSSIEKSFKVHNKQELIEYMYKNDHPGLMYARITSNYGKEILDQQGSIPGVTVSEYSKIKHRRN